jgi:D-alanyl-D-alanine carboxypeptidase (penicillin-binding protein 5/6)
MRMCLAQRRASPTRSEAATAALQWGFQNFATVKPALPAVKPVRVWKGAVSEVTPEPAKDVYITVARGLETKLTSTVHQEESVTAPVKAGDKLGEIIFAADGNEVAKIPLIAKAEIKQGGFFKRLWDSVVMAVRGWFKKK